MLEWLKTILGEAYTEDIDTKVSAEIGKAFVSKTDFNAKNEALKTAEGLVKERDKQLETLKAAAGDAEATKKQIEQLQAENKATAEKYEADLKQLKLDSIIETRLIKEGAVNSKAVRALLDHEKISLDGDNVLGLDEQLKTLKTAEKWAFQQSQGGNPAGGGANPPGAGGVDELATLEADHAAALKSGNTALAIAIKNKIYSVRNK